MKQNFCFLLGIKNLDLSVLLFIQHMLALNVVSIQLSHVFDVQVRPSTCIFRNSTCIMHVSRRIPQSLNFCWRENSVFQKALHGYRLKFLLLFGKQNHISEKRMFIGSFVKLDISLLLIYWIWYQHVNTQLFSLSSRIKPQISQQI